MIRILLVLLSCSFHFGNSNWLNRSQSITEFFQNDGKLVVLMFYGRREYVKVLLPYLLAAKRGTHKYAVVDKVYIAPNTVNVDDLKYLEDIIDNDYIVKSPMDDIGHGSYGFCGILSKFIPPCNSTLIIKIDDDLVYIHQHAFYNMLRYKLKFPNVFAVSANVINHSNLGYAQAMTGLFMNWRNYSASRDVLSDFYFENKATAPTKQFNSGGMVPLEQHRMLLSHLKAGNEIETYSTFRVWDFNADGFQRTFSINCIIYNPSDFVYNSKHCISGGDEAYLSQYLPRLLNKHCVAIGHALVAHFAFHMQLKDGVLLKSGILNEYREYAMTMHLHNRSAHDAQ